MAGVKDYLKRMFGIEGLNGRIDTMNRFVDERLKAIEGQIPSIAGELKRLDSSIPRPPFLPPQEYWENVLTCVRSEYTALPRFLYHQPLDYQNSTYPPKFAPIETISGEPFPIPGPADRMGYCPNDPARYLQIGKRDHDFLLGLMDRHGVPVRDAAVLDFGCSSGRVLRHFENEYRERGWKPKGVDVQALPVEWIRRHLPKHFEVSVCSVFPHLPFEDNSLDAIYGISVFTHIKYLWDMWVQELRRVLKPSGLLLMSIHAEPAWEYYHRDREVSYVKDNLPADMLSKPKMDVDYFYYGDQGVSQVFWKAEVAREFWGRYLTVVDVLPPPPESFQSWMVCKKPG